MLESLIPVAVNLGAELLAVPATARLGLGSVPGYLAAGIQIAPVAGLTGADIGYLQHVAEFGVVMVLFLIGLKLEPCAFGTCGIG